MHRSAKWRVASATSRRPRSAGRSSDSSGSLQEPLDGAGQINRPDHLRSTVNGHRTAKHNEEGDRRDGPDVCRSPMKGHDSFTASLTRSSCRWKTSLLTQLIEPVLHHL